MEVEFDNGTYKCSKTLADKLQKAIIPKYTIGEELFFIKGASVISVFVIKIIITQHNITYEISVDKTMLQGSVVDENILYSNREVAEKTLQKMCY